MDAQGKVALVTGASMGVGAAMAVTLARAGAAVAVNYRRSEEGARETLQAVEAAGGRGVLIQADVSDDAQVRRMVETVERELGGLSILVNNAAFTYHIPFSDLEALTDEVWDSLYDTNVKGTFYCARAAAPVMRRSGGGVIINLGSIAGVTGGGSSIPYAVSKGAVHLLTRSLARALAPDIRVNCVAPGYIDTYWHARGLGDERAAKLRVETAQRTPLGRVCAPEDVAQAVMSLIATDFVTGQLLLVEGGAAL